MQWMTRRCFGSLVGIAAMGVAGAAPADPVARQLGEIEKSLRARLGVWVLDTQTRRSWGHRADERFPMCGIFMLMACAALLVRADEGKVDLSRRVRFTARELLPNSPVAQQSADAQGLTLAQLCEAALTRNDHTAGSLILKWVGGPDGLTTFMNSQGDAMSRLDHWAPALNEAMPGDPRDTTTPAAMGDHLRALLLGSTLSHPSRRLLTAWLLANKAGGARLRAGLPPGWDIGNKTAVGNHGTTNDVAIVWPPNHKPLIVSVFVTATAASVDQRNAAIAEIGSLLDPLVHSRSDT
jgi:beta-lactamase class A